MSEDRAPQTGPGRRGPGAVAASILAALLFGGYFVASPGSADGVPSEFAVNAVVLILVFWFPAMRITRPADVWQSWKGLIPWILAWTLVWDLATSGIVGDRALFQEWWLVYPSGLATMLLLLLLHGLVVGRVHAARRDG